MNRRKSVVFVCCLSFLCGFAPRVVSAQSSASVSSATATNPETQSKEITVAGTIQQVKSQHVAGSPAGVHLLIAGPQGFYDTSVGPFLSNEARNQLASGRSIQVIGTVREINGQSFLFARQVTVEGNQITVRNENGFLVRTRPAGQTHTQNTFARGAGQ